MTLVGMSALYVKKTGVLECRICIFLYIKLHRPRPKMNQKKNFHIKNKANQNK